VSVQTRGPRTESRGGRLRGAGERLVGLGVRVVRALDALALPQRCPSCGIPAPAERLLCDACWAAIPPLAVPLCARCLARGQGGSAGLPPIGCLAHPGHAVWPAWVYEERAAALVHALKYGARPGLARALAEPLARTVPAGAGFDLVTAVPLHRARRRERGYNQAEALAAALADRVGVPLLADALERARATRPQARLGPAARRANLAGAFRARHPRRIEGRRLLIVDDVLTTGATLEACADAALAAGAHPTGVTLAWAS